MRNIWITLAYDGRQYGGFQRQRNAFTVQEAVENCLERLTGKRTVLYFVGRTDAGVHACAQECTFYTDSTIPGERFIHAMNIDLPDDIRVVASREVAPDFSVRKQNTGKTYTYLFTEEREWNPFLRPYVWRTGKTLDEAVMKDGAQVLIGTHDFTSFRGSNTVPASPVRTIYDIRIVRDGGLFRLYVTGNGFLYHMVRNIAGALVDVGSGKIGVHELGEILAAKDRQRLGVTAPAHALCLFHVYFTPITKGGIDAVLAKRNAPWT